MSVAKPLMPAQRTTVTQPVSLFRTPLAPVSTFMPGPQMATESYIPGQPNIPGLPGYVSQQTMPFAQPFAQPVMESYFPGAPNNPTLPGYVSQQTQPFAQPVMESYIPGQPGLQPLPISQFDLSKMNKPMLPQPSIGVVTQVGKPGTTTPLPTVKAAVPAKAPVIKTKAK